MHARIDPLDPHWTPIARSTLGSIAATLPGAIAVFHLLKEVQALTKGTTPPAGACNAWEALYKGIAQFAGDLVGHIHIENHLLFSQFEARPGGGGECGSSCGCS